jgi:hypothetical protein
MDGINNSNRLSLDHRAQPENNHHDVEVGVTPAAREKQFSCLPKRNSTRLACGVGVLAGVAAFGGSAIYGAVSLAASIRSRNHDINLGDILPASTLINILPGALQDNAYLTSMVAVFKNDPERMRQYFSDDNGTVMVDVNAPPGWPEDTTNPVPLDKPMVRDLVKDSGEKLSTLKQLGNPGVLATRALEVGLAQKFMAEGSSAEVALRKVELLTVEEGLYVLTGNKAKSFEIKECESNSEVPCQSEAYIKIAKALNKKDPVVLTRPDGKNYAVNSLSPIGEIDWPYQISTEIFVQTQEVNSEYDEQSLNQPGAKVTIGHLDNPDVRSEGNENEQSNTIPLTPRITPSPSPSAEPSPSASARPSSTPEPFSSPSPTPSARPRPSASPTPKPSAWTTPLPSATPEPSVPTAKPRTLGQPAVQPLASTAPKAATGDTSDEAGKKKRSSQAPTGRKK